MAIKDYSSTPSSNTAISGIGIVGGSAVNNFDNAMRQQLADIANWTDRDTLASATTTDLGSVEGMYVNVTGTTTITGFGTLKDGMVKFVRFDGALVLTHNATSLILPGAANITTAAGDAGVFVSEGSGNWRCLSYQRASLPPLQFATATDQEAGSSSTLAVSPSLQQRHQSAAKAWASVPVISGSYSNQKAYNISSVVKNSTGNLTVTWGTAFSDALYPVFITPYDVDRTFTVSARTTTTATILIRNLSGTATDGGFAILAFGDL